MSTLTNTKIKDTYPGLIKTADNLGITATPKDLQDGLGNAINMQVLEGQINFPSGTVDFTGSTVNGLPAPEPAGLTAGTGTDSMKSADSLTTTPANASGTNSVAIGSNARATGSLGATAVGDGANASGQFGTAIGRNTIASASGSLALGNDAQATGFGNNISLGYSSRSTNASTVAIGDFTNASASGAVALGNAVSASTVDTVTIKKLQMLDYATLNYADDAAAATGGIPLGGVYHTAGALKIRIA